MTAGGSTVPAVQRLLAVLAAGRRVLELGTGPTTRAANDREAVYAAEIVVAPDLALVLATRL